VRFECRLEGVPESFQAQVCGRRLGGPAAESAIDLLVSVQDKGHPRQVVIEVEHFKVYAAHVGNTNEHKLAGQIGDPVQASNLLVEVRLVGSVLAAEDGEQRFAGACRFRLRRRVVRAPAWVRPRLLLPWRTSNQRSERHQRERVPQHQTHSETESSGERAWVGAAVAKRLISWRASAP
jgi:hypothetical protein